MSAPDFSSYTLEQLADAYHNINKNMYPENYKLLIKELKDRGMTEFDFYKQINQVSNYSLQNNIRSYGKVLFLGIITLGIYWYYWYYINLSELGSHFTFEKGENDIEIANKAFLVYVIIQVVTVAISMMMLTTKLSTLQTAPQSPELGPLINMFFSRVIESVFIFLFMNAVKLGQEKANVNTISLFPMFLLYLAGSFFYIFYYASMNPFFTFFGAILLIVFYYQLQSEINKIWKAEMTMDKQEWILS